MPNLLFPISATATAELHAVAARLADEVDEQARPLPALAAELSAREHLPVRAVVVAEDHGQLAARLRSVAEDQPGTGAAVGAVGPSTAPVWVFSGHGSQWAGMGAALLASEPVFADQIDLLEPLVAAEAGFSLREVLSGPAAVTDVAQVQPTLFAMQVALAATWRAYGPEPAAVIGHSMGEIAAAVAVGALSHADGARAICRRSALMRRIAGAGAMAMVALSEQEVRADLAEHGHGGVSIAALSGPTSTVIAGEPGQVSALVAAWEARELMARTVKVEVASHSPQVEPILPELAAALATLRPARPRVRFYSTVLDDPRAQPALDAGYWTSNLRRPVRFASAVNAALADGHRLFVEVSPHPLLTHALRENAEHAGLSATVLSTVRRGGDAALRFRTQLGALHCAGAPLNWPLVQGTAVAGAPR